MRRGANTRIPMVMPQGSQAALEGMHGNFHGSDAASAPPLLATQTITRGGQTIKEGGPDNTAPPDGSRWAGVQGNRGGDAAARWRALAAERREFHSTTTAMPPQQALDSILADPGRRGPTQALARAPTYAGPHARKPTAPADGRERPSELSGMWQGSGQGLYDPPGNALVESANVGPSPHATGPSQTFAPGHGAEAPPMAGSGMRGGAIDWRGLARGALPAVEAAAKAAAPHAISWASKRFFGGAHAGGDLPAGGSHAEFEMPQKLKRRRASPHPQSLASKRHRLVGCLMRGGGMSLGEASSHVKMHKLGDMIRAGHEPEALAAHVLSQTSS